MRCVVKFGILRDFMTLEREESLREQVLNHRANTWNIKETIDLKKRLDNEIARKLELQDRGIDE